MKIVQLSVFIENRAGVLAELTTFLGDSGINIRALSIAESRDFGVLRMIVPDPAAAAERLRSRGYRFQEVEVLAVKVADRPGGLARALSALAAEGLNVDYLYTFLDKLDNRAVIIFRADNPDFAETVLDGQGFEFLGPEDFGRI
ncbi:MAG TPA: ACT domain-containing protein [Syntrophales bacterium]|jgi:hypothetical protein|nr:ACT domain-containing protein [Syntrophales bacterium]